MKTYCCQKSTFIITLKKINDVPYHRKVKSKAGIIKLNVTFSPHLSYKFFDNEFEC